MTGFSTRNEPVEGQVVDMEEVQALVQKTNPRLLLSGGFIVVAVLLWLMRFKPF